MRKERKRKKQLQSERERERERKGKDEKRVRLSLEIIESYFMTVMFHEMMEPWLEVVLVAE